ncbi:hypothetical protein EDD38_7264 [Kitasatospora cineracea]|uniref:Uncharacterized protein n=2 Tax=Kitasatospora cineracea TaxID=88074 RepID=A0A3N4RV65_9ACTN|nr:hypothetical protein EDD38_7264 [Kitasatospora cineracea]
MVPLWRRRTYGNRRVLLLEKPSPSGTLRDLLADRALPDDHVLDQIPGDRRLVILLDRLAPPERAVVLAFGHPGVVTWADAAGHTGSAEPEQDGDKVRRVLRELCRRDEQRSDGPTGLWSPARHGGAQ